MTCWDDYSTEELADILSDYHKDVFGYRMRMAGAERHRLIEELVYLDMYMADMKSTPEGRAQLRADGWDIQEPNC